LTHAKEKTKQSCYNSLITTEGFGWYNALQLHKTSFSTPKSC